VPADTAAVRIALASFALGLLPGLLWVGASHPRANELATRERLLLSLLASLASATLLGLSLSLAGTLTTGAVAAGLGALTLAGALAASVRTCAWRDIAGRAIGDCRQREGLAGALLVLGYAGAHAFAQASAGTASPHPSWNYLADVHAMLDTRGLPATTLDYGVAFPFETNKLVWYLGLAQWIALAGLRDAPWTVVHVASVATSGLVALAAWVWLRALYGNGGLAWLATACVLWLPRVVYKLAGLRGEALGLGLLFALLWLGLRVLRGRDPRDLVAAAVCAATLGGVHIVPAATALLWMLALAIALLLTAGRAAAAGVLRLAAAGGLGALLLAGL